MKTINENIIYIVENHPECANDDRKLITKFWQLKGLDLDDEQIHKILRLTTPETITRARRKLIEEGRIKASSEATVRRRKREIEFRNEYSDKKIRYIGNTAYIE